MSATIGVSRQAVPNLIESEIACQRKRGSQSTRQRSHARTTTEAAPPSHLSMWPALPSALQEPTTSKPETERSTLSRRDGVASPSTCKHGHSDRLALIPIELGEANAFIAQFHRHHKPTVGHRFSIAAALDGEIVGVAIVGRPVARGNQDGWTVEVTRLASSGERNVCSFLYGACRKAAFALGYRRIITYILDTEPGTTLKAAGFRLLGVRGGGSWDCRSRPRVDRHPLQEKLLWEAVA